MKDISKPRLIIVAGPNGAGKTTITEKLLRHEWMEDCLASMTSMAVETVFSTSEKVEFVRSAKATGFFVRLFFVCTNDPSINAQRIALRVMEGGHDVPIPKIISRYYRSIANCVNVISLVDRVYFYDNTETDADPLLMFRVTNGKIAKTYTELVPWAKDIAAILPQS